MAEEGLKIKIGADVQSAVTSLNTLNASLNKTTQTAANVGTAGMNNLTKGTSQASAAITNFSRVASDAPFGLIGIANNIEPLVQSFVQLRKEAGSGKAVLQALTASLTGGGGLVLAVSAVTSILQFAELGFSRWGAGAKDAKDKTKELKDEQRSFNDILKEVSSQLSKEAANVAILVQSLKSETSTREQRTNAIKELNKIAPEVFKNLNAEKIEVDKLNIAYQNYINTLQGKIRLGIFETQLNEIIKQEIALSDVNSEYVKTRTAIEKITEQRIKDARAAGQGENLIQSQIKQGLTLDQERNKLAREKEKILNNILIVQNELNKQIKTTSSLETTSNDKSKNSANELTDLLKNYNEQLKGINWDEQNRQIDGTKKRLELAGETLKTLYIKGVKETSQAWIQVKSDFDKFQTAYDQLLRDQRLKQINEDVKNYVSNIGSYSENVLGKSQKNTIKVLQEAGKVFLNIYKLQQKNLEDLRKKNLELANTITGYLSPALEGVFESLVKGEDPFETLKNSVQQLIIELGKAVIKSLILKAVTSAIGSPAAGQAAGAGLGFIRGDQLRGLTFGR